MKAYDRCSTKLNRARTFRPDERHDCQGLEKKKSLDHQLVIMIAKRSDLYEQSQEKDVCYVKVSQACYPDVMIKIKEFKKSVTVVRENVSFMRQENG